MVERRESPVARPIPVLIVLCLIGLPAHAKYGGGSGTADDPYQIATAADLIALGDDPSDYDKHFILTADIDLDPNLPGGKVFDDVIIAPLRYAPRGWATPLFGGIFDGRNHTIRNLTIAGSGYLGLFGGLDIGAAIVNLGLEGVDIDSTAGDAGSLAGWNEGGITNCFSTGVVHALARVGGLVGWNLSRIRNCYSTGAVSGLAGVGGLVGENSNLGTIANCYSAGVVSGNSPACGGLIGMGILSDVLASFWDIQVSGQTTTSGAGIGKTTAEMQTAGTFLEAGWDFAGETKNGTEDIWWIDEGKDYPRLWWEAAQP